MIYQNINTKDIISVEEFNAICSYLSNASNEQYSDEVGQWLEVEVAN